MHNAQRRFRPVERRLPFYSDCVSWPRDLVDTPGGLVEMIEGAREISRRTFLAKVDRQALAEIEDHLGYTRSPRQGLTMAGDYHVGYRRGRLFGRRVYFFIHSAIEFVFSESPAEAA